MVPNIDFRFYLCDQVLFITFLDDVFSDLFYYFTFGNDVKIKIRKIELW